MQSIRIRISRIIDFGKIVSIVGIDLTSNKDVVVNIDHRPFHSIWETWQAAGHSQPITFEAERLVLSLEVTPED